LISYFDSGKPSRAVLSGKIGCKLLAPVVKAHFLNPFSIGKSCLTQTGSLPSIEQLIVGLDTCLFHPVTLAHKARYFKMQFLGGI
jgi:hypothetical protein